MPSGMVADMRTMLIAALLGLATASACSTAIVFPQGDLPTIGLPGGSGQMPLSPPLSIPFELAP